MKKWEKKKKHIKTTTNQKITLYPSLARHPVCALPRANVYKNLEYMVICAISTWYKHTKFPWDFLFKIENERKEMRKRWEKRFFFFERLVFFWTLWVFFGIFVLIYKTNFFPWYKLQEGRSWLFRSFLYPQCLEQCQAHSRCSENIC